ERNGWRDGQRDASDRRGAHSDGDWHPGRLARGHCLQRVPKEDPGRRRQRPVDRDAGARADEERAGETLMPGALARGRNGGRIIAAINVTPLVDVVLVLLIILMVSSTYIVAQTLKVHLPRTKSTDGQAGKPATITILKTGALRWNDGDATEDAIVANLRSAVAADPDVSLVVSADRDVSHGRVVHVLDVAKLAGIVKFAINVQAE